MSIVHLGAGEVSLCRRRRVVPTAPAGQSRSRVQTSRATRSRDRTLSHMLKINGTKPVSKPKATSASTLVNLRPAVGVWTPPPVWFFADTKKTASHSSAGFSLTSPPSFPQRLWEFQFLGHARSGDQVRSSNPTIQKLYNRATATVFERKLWNFRNLIRSSVPTERIYRISYIRDLRACHFRDLPNISQWAKTELPVNASSGAYMNGITLCKVFIDTSSDIFRRWPL